MRPLKLSMRSFGPFIGEQVVDFTRYGDNAFLLIHGPTGAGKTTILDGICYALYGDPSGEKRDERYLRSQRASAESICEVEFLFQVGPRRFHIKRTPPQKILQKGKPREIKHLVELCQIDEQGAVIGERFSKVGEVRQKVEEVLGFTSEQFRQVVVLPQGEFRKLLLAKSDEKEHILEKLFGTGRFKLLELSLKNRRTTLGAELKELKAAVEALLTSNNVASTQELEQQITTLESKRQELSGQLAQQIIRQQQADQQLQEAQALSARFTELEQSRAIHGKLATQQKGMEQLAARSEVASRALNLVDLDELITKTGKDLHDRTQELAALESTISGLAIQRQTVQQQLQQARIQAGQVPALTAEKTRLDAQLLKIRELESGRLRLEQAQKIELAGRKTVEKLKAATVLREEQITALTISIENLSQGSGQTGQLQAEADQLAKLGNVRQQLENDITAKTRLELELQTAVAAVITAEQQQQQLQSCYEDLQQRFVSGQAALLVQELANGKPCPVCGSMDHPNPAESAKDLPTDKELEKVRKQIAGATAKQQSALAGKGELQVQVGALAAGIQKLQEQLGVLAEQPLQAVERQQQELAQKLAQAVADRKKLEEQRLERTQLQTALVSDKEKLVQTEKTQTAATADLEGQRAVVASLCKEAGELDAAAVSQRIAELDKSCSNAQAALQKAETGFVSIESRLSAATGQQGEKQNLVKRLEAELAGQKQLFGIRLDTEGFATERDWREARLPRTEIEKNRKMVQQYFQELAAADERLARAEGACNGLERPDLVAVQAVKTQVDLQVGALQKEAGHLEAAQNALKSAFATIAEKGIRMVRLEQEYAVAGRLADLSGGQNSKRMTLQRYVLAALFEDVAIAASQRLTRMSQGRYHLVRSGEIRDGKSTSGLDLDVTDDYSGEKRPAFTLSGGESFLASLSLALGLSDVVMAQSGGRYLDCIFIDEGFGSLDGETLDFALNTLIELHRSGRVIGIISHVAELKDRIQSRLEVVSTKEGSRIVME